MANDHLDGSWYIWIHSLLIAGSILMLFPFVWMISTSFKSQAEILSEDESIVLLPDILRPSIFDGEADTRRKQRRQEQMSAWAAYQERQTQRKAQCEQLKRQGLQPSRTPEAYPKDQSGFKSAEEPWVEEPPTKPFHFWDNYRRALEMQPFYRYFLNTFFVAITTTALQLFFASLAAYSFAFFSFPLKDKLFFLMLGTMMIPQQALLIPNYTILSKLGWINTYMSLIVPWIASAYSIFFLRQFFLQLPKDLFEAAKIDGCTRFQFYYKIVLPLSKPPMITLGIFSFLASWNSFVWPLIVTNDERLRVIQVGLSYFSSEAGTEWGPLMAASTMTIVPLVVIYLLAQRQFVESQTMTGMKE